MVDKTRNTLLAAARALRTTVLAALPPDHQTAREQARLVAAVLEFTADHNGHEFFRKARQLELYVEMAHEVVDAVTCFDRSEPAATTLRARLETHPSEQAVAGRDFAMLVTAVDEIAELISELVRDVHSKDRPEQALADRIVVTHSARIIELDRSWFVDQGFDPAPGQLPSLAAALQPSTTATDLHASAFEQGATS